MMTSVKMHDGFPGNDNVCKVRDGSLVEAVNTNCVRNDIWKWNT